MNKYERSVRKGLREKDEERRNPLLKVANLMNVYHSLDDRYMSDEEKIEVKKYIRAEIYKVRRVSNRLRNMLKSAMGSKELWIKLKDQFL